MYIVSCFYFEKREKSPIYSILVTTLNTFSSQIIITIQVAHEDKMVEEMFLKNTFLQKQSSFVFEFFLR